MKTRNGFVSNSSSSSFILNYYDGKDEKKFTVKQVEKNLSKMFDLYEDLTGSKIDREDVRVSEITGKEYKESHKYYLEQFSYITLKDNQIYVEIATGENVIPYALMQFVEDIFNAHRIHLG